VRRLAIAFVLCGVVSPACHKETDTNGAKVWRTVEPRLMATDWAPCTPLRMASGQLVQNAQCGTPVEQSGAACYDITSHQEAVRRLSSHPRCITQVIVALKRESRPNAAIWSEVAAAYYVRAQRDDRASDLLEALAAAKRALEASPGMPEALFNLALTQETLGLKYDAVKSWDAVSKVNEPGWRNEALEHLRRLQTETASDPAAVWERSTQRIPALLRSGDNQTVAKLIAPFPRPALIFFEEELLPSGDQTLIPRFATILYARVHDRFVLDLAAAAPRNHEGHIAFQKARRADDALLYEDAASKLRNGGSPLFLEAEQRRAVRLVSSDIAKRAEGEAARRQYPYLLGLIRASRGYIEDRTSEYLQSIAEYDSAKTAFEAVDDRQSLASAYRSIAGDYSSVAQYELAFREAIRALRNLPYVTDTRIRHTIVGEAGRAATGLGHPEMAMTLQESAIQRLQYELQNTRDTFKIAVIQKNLSSALRGRARLELDLQDYEAARRDIGEANRLNSLNAPDSRMVEAYLVEMEARVAFDPASAVGAFTRAIEHVRKDEMRTFRASLYAQRAGAQRRLGRVVEAGRDLELALQELSEEEKHLVATRQRGQGEEIWKPYFSRFEDAYRQLIDQLIKGGESDKAFVYAERMRAFEPLDLILKLDFIPAEFRRLTRNGPMSSADIQKHLPPGTWLLQYSVTEDKTYIWIVSRDSFQLIDRKIDRRDIARWTTDLQEAGRLADGPAFAKNLDAPFRTLIAPALAKIGKTPERLVIIPDAPMHGLPFAALRDSTGKYLVELAPLEIDGSATLYIFSLMRDAALRRVPPSALLVGDPKIDPRWTFTHGLRQLDSAVPEVQAIRPLYEPRVDVLVNEDATVRRFLDHARDKTVIHFAGHAIVNPSEPWQSLLLLARSPERSGALSASELLSFRLDQTRLVVLSACSSAAGLGVGPEGVAPLVRPLIAAGVPAVVGTLWDVEDATVKDLSVSFHRHYEEGNDAAKALQRAQLDKLGNRDPQFAVSWASFQVTGHASSPFEPTR
jgi:CHAT domain-containing protein/tetratricopeptide (TPR) repeat protein